nr:DUF427 domain-containing protein [Massilia sp. JS1662]
MDRLQRTDRHTHCPYKGDCSYFSIADAGPRGENAVWCMTLVELHVSTCIQR